MPPARYETDGDVAEIVISNPPLNLWGPPLIAALEDGVAGGGPPPPPPRRVGAPRPALTGRLLRLTHAVEDLPLPTLAVVHGLCLTAGLELSLACDLMWAAEGVQFGLVETVVGITPLMGGTQRMAERAGTARAREFVMTGRLYDAQTLHAWGVVNRVVAPDDLLAKSRRFAAGLAAGPTIAHAATKAIVRAQADHGTRGADERTAELTSHLFETEDAVNAVQSFLREGPGKAVFTGKL
jgi:enoyl-CoA hydratase